MRKTVVILLIAMLSCAAGCGKSRDDMTLAEMKALPKEEREALTKDMTAEELGWLMRGSISHALDTATLNEMTIGELIEEGRRVSEERERKREERRKERAKND